MKGWRAIVALIFISCFMVAYSVYLYRATHPPLPATVFEIRAHQNVSMRIRNISFGLFFGLLHVLYRQAKYSIELEIYSVGVIYIFVSFMWKASNDFNYFLQWQAKELYIINTVALVLSLLVVWYARRYNYFEDAE